MFVNIVFWLSCLLGSQVFGYQNYPWPSNYAPETIKCPSGALFLEPGVSSKQLVVPSDGLCALKVTVLSGLVETSDLTFIPFNNSIGSPCSDTAGITITDKVKIVQTPAAPTTYYPKPETYPKPENRYTNNVYKQPVNRQYFEYRRPKSNRPPFRPLDNNLEKFISQKIDTKLSNKFKKEY